MNNTLLIIGLLVLLVASLTIVTAYNKSLPTQEELKELHEKIKKEELLYGNNLTCEIAPTCEIENPILHLLDGVN